MDVLKQILDAIRGLAIPGDRLWFDPRALAANTSVQYTNFTFAATQLLQILPQNTRRWGVGFYWASPSIAMQLSPWSDTNLIPFVTTSNVPAPNMYTIFNYGTLISNGWYCNTQGPNSLRVVELIRN
jgi:hypothetical protein